ncbi:MAG: cytochrome P450 [Litoreibacter sp.]
MKSTAQSPTDPEFVQDPYPFYDTLRGADLTFWTDYNMPVAANHAVVSALLRDKRFGRENPCPPPVPARLSPFYNIEAHSMLELEPPRHTRLRGLVLRAFTSRRVKELQPEIEQISHHLIDQFPSTPFDLLPAFAQTIPVIIIARLLGVPEHYAPELLGWSNAMVAMYRANRTSADEDAAVQASTDFTTFLKDIIANKRMAPADDLLSHLITAEQEGQKLSTDELITTSILLLNAGHEATVHTLGNAIKTLLETGHRPQRTTEFTEEVLRHDPPLHFFNRFAMADCHAFGHDFKQGDEVGLLLAAANRDPVVYDDPNRFIPDRSAKAHTSFGGGIHFCVGAPLARLEIATSLQVLFERCPDLQLHEKPKYADVYHFHGLDSLKVTKA